MKNVGSSSKVGPTRPFAPTPPPSPKPTSYSLPLYPAKNTLNHLKKSVVATLAVALSDKGQPLIDGVNVKYELNVARANSYIVIHVGPGRAFVRGTQAMENLRRTVDLLNAWCSCGMWHLYGFPCVHGCAAAIDFGYTRNLETWFTEKNFDKAFLVSALANFFRNPPIITLPVMEQLPSEGTMLCPVIVKKKGRPATKRFRTAGLQGGVAPPKRNKCGRCGVIGDNIHTCTQTLE